MKTQSKTANTCLAIIFSQRNVYGRHSLREQLKWNKPNANITDAQIDDLMNSY